MLLKFHRMHFWTHRFSGISSKLLIIRLPTRNITFVIALYYGDIWKNLTFECFIYCIVEFLVEYLEETLGVWVPHPPPNTHSKSEIILEKWAQNGFKGKLLALSPNRPIIRKNAVVKNLRNFIILAIWFSCPIEGTNYVSRMKTWEDA